MTFDFKNASKADLKKEYDRIAKKIGDDRFFTRKELNYLPQILQDGEQVLAFTSGLMDGNSWLIVLTERRIIFLDKGMLYGLEQKDIPLNRVNAVSCKTGLMLGTIIVTDGATERVINNVWKGAVKKFTNKALEAIYSVSNKKTTSTQMSQAEDPYDRLAKLASLKDKGIISEEEFKKEKQKILG